MQIAVFLVTTNDFSLRISFSKTNIIAFKGGEHTILNNEVVYQINTYLAAQSGTIIR